jgi:hypothetical protein
LFFQPVFPGLWGIPILGYFPFFFSCLAFFFSLADLAGFFFSSFLESIDFAMLSSCEILIAPCWADRENKTNVKNPIDCHPGESRKSVKKTQRTWIPVSTGMMMPGPEFFPNLTGKISTHLCRYIEQVYKKGQEK